MTYKYPLKIMKVEDDIGVCLFLYIVIYFMHYTLDLRKLLVRWTLSLRKVVRSTALYCAVRLWIHGNYWCAGLSVRGEY